MMKKIFEWIGGFALIVFSFYFTDRVSLLVASKSKLMQEIKSVSATFYEKPIDAKIDKKNNTVVPGIYGKKINEEESYTSMKEFGIFNKNYLVYNLIKPKNSLRENIDKYIISGNPLIRNVSLIVNDNEEVTSFLSSENIKFDEIVKSSDRQSDGEIINGAKDKKEFENITSEKKLCIYEYSNLNECFKKKYFILKPIIKLNSSNIITVKDQVTPGILILIDDNARIEHVKVLLGEIKYKDLSIVYVSELINEEK